MSVIVPTSKNQREPLLMIALESLVNQVLAGDEIIVVSNYHSSRIQKFCDDNSIIFKFTDLMSLGDKILLGVELSKSEIIAFLEDDDVFFPDKIGQLKIVFSRNQHLVYYHNNYDCIDGEGNPTSSYQIRQINKPLPVRDFPIDSYKLSSKIRNTPFGGLSSTAIRRSSVKEEIRWLKGVNYMCDQTIFFLTMLSGGEAFFDPVRLSYYRIHNSGTHSFENQTEFRKNKEKSIIEYYEGWTKIRAFCRDTNLYEVAQTEYLYNDALYKSYIEKQKASAFVRSMEYFKQYSTQTGWTRALFYASYLILETLFGGFLTALGYRISRWN